MPSWLLNIGLALTISFSAFILMAALFVRQARDFPSFPTVLQIACTAQLALNLATTRAIVLEAAGRPEAVGGILAAFNGLLPSSPTLAGLILSPILVSCLFCGLRLIQAGKGAGDDAQFLSIATLALPALFVVDTLGGGLSASALGGLPFTLVLPSVAQLAMSDALAFFLPLALVALAFGAMAGEPRQAPAAFQEQLQAEATAMPSAPAQASTPVLTHGVTHGVDPIRLELGFGLLKLLAPTPGNPESGTAQLNRQITALRRQLSSEMGLVLPALRIRENLELPTNDYRLCLREIEAARGSLRPQKLLLCDPRGEAVELPGEPATDPLSDLPAKWCDSALRADAARQGYHAATPLEVIAGHLAVVAMDHLPDLLGYQETQELLDSLPAHDQRLVADTVPARLSLGRFQKVLQALLRERVAIRDLPVILEALVDNAAPNHGTSSLEIADLADLARLRLSRQITRAANDSSGRLPIVTLSPDWEDRLTARLKADGEDKRLVLSAAERERLEAALGKALDRQALLGETPVLVTCPALRRPLRRLLESWRRETTVLAENEIDPKAYICRLEEV